MDETFKEKSKFSIVVNMTRQSLTVKNGVIYYCTYESGKKTKYQKQYDGVLKSEENAIYVYDLNGNKKTIYYIPKTYNNESFNEIENVSFDGDKIIVQFNQHGKAGYYTSISKLKNYTLTGNSKNNNSSNTKNNTNNVNSNSSSNSTNISDSSNNNLSNINNKNETNNNMNSSNNETNSSNNTFNINNTNTSNKDSNTSSNGLKDTQNTNTSNTNKTSNNSISNNTKRSTANNISNVDNSRSSTKIVKVPNTDTNSYIEIIGLFIIVGALLFIVKLRIFYEK